MTTPSDLTPFVFPARYVRNYDGDTITFDIDLGFQLWSLDRSVRLDGIDTPELRTPNPLEAKQAELARDRVKYLMVTAKNIMIRSNKLEKYGRALADVFYEDADGWHDLAQVLIDEGHGREYDGGRR